jgi:hypothetical protein
MSTMYIAWRGDGPVPPHAHCVCGNIHESGDAAGTCAREHGLQVRLVNVRITHCDCDYPPMEDADADPKAEQRVRQGEAEAAAAFAAYEQGLVDDPYSLIPD